VRTGKARSAIRHYLKTMRLNESVQLGERLVDQSLKGYGFALADVTPEVWDKLVQWTGNKSRQEIFADIGLGRRVAAVMAKRIEVLMSGRDADDDLPKSERHPAHHAPPVVITGTEGMSVQFSACCRPIPGDAIMGYIGIGLGMAIHTTDCRVAQRIHRRDPGRWIDVECAAAGQAVRRRGEGAGQEHGHLRARCGGHHVGRREHRAYRDGRRSDARVDGAALRHPGQRPPASRERCAACAPIPT
jgi:(p)ppGpp synthase/HD superfamily hydrolase